MDLMNFDKCPSIALKVNFLSIIWVHYQTFFESRYMESMFS